MEVIDYSEWTDEGLKTQYKENCLQKVDFAWVTG